MYSLERPPYVLLDAYRRKDGDDWLEGERRWTLALMRGRGLRPGARALKTGIVSGATHGFVPADDPTGWQAYWFGERYVSPGAWREVLKDHKKLRLCLAHFGNDEGDFSRWNDGDPETIRTDLATDLSDETFACWSCSLASSPPSPPAHRNLE